MPRDSNAPPAATPERPAPGTSNSAVLALVGVVGGTVAGLLIGDIRDDEGRVYHAYRDIGGIVTACDGDTHDVRMGQTFTDPECDARTARQLLAHATIVIRCAPELREVGREQQLRAVTRFDYNTGAFCKGWWRKRPAPAAIMRSGDWRGGCDELLRYDLVKGARIRGLTLRRQREWRVCVSTLPRPKPPPPVRPADFPVCSTIKPPPLLRSPQGRVDFRVGEQFNDKGII